MLFKIYKHFLLMLLFCCQELPFDVSVCVFVLEQALSVRALQEMVSAKSQENVRPHFVTSATRKQE